MTSKDGTSIAYESIGAGPCVILVSGGLDDGSENEPLARELAAGFSVYNYARRGRGASGDTLQWREAMNEMTLRVTSADGTRIAYDRKGTGPAVILVGGTLDDGAENAPLAGLLANHFTVYNYARRGRGASGNTPPYALAREVEDLDALIATAGGSAHVYGASSGGALVLEAAAAGSAIDKIAVWDVPYVIGDDLWPRFNQYLADTREAYKAGRDEELLELFMRLTGGPDADFAAAKQHPL